MCWQSFLRWLQSHRRPTSRRLAATRHPSASRNALVCADTLKVDHHRPLLDHSTSGGDPGGLIFTFSSASENAYRVAALRRFALSGGQVATCRPKREKSLAARYASEAHSLALSARIRIKDILSRQSCLAGILPVTIPLCGAGGG